MRTKYMLNTEIEADKSVVSENYWLEIWKIDLGGSEVFGKPKLIWNRGHAYSLKNSPVLRAGILGIISAFSPCFLHFMPFSWYDLVSPHWWMMCWISL